MIPDNLITKQWTVVVLYFIQFSQTKKDLQKRFAWMTVNLPCPCQDLNLEPLTNKRKQCYQLHHKDFICCQQPKCNFNANYLEYSDICLRKLKKQIHNRNLIVGIKDNSSRVDKTTETFFLPVLSSVNYDNNDRVVGRWHINRREEAAIAQ